MLTDLSAIPSLNRDLSHRCHASSIPQSLIEGVSLDLPDVEWGILIRAFQDRRECICCAILDKKKEDEK